MDAQSTHLKFLRSPLGVPLEAIALFAVLAAPYFLLDEGLSLLVSGGLALIYLVGTYVAATRGAHAMSPSGPRVAGFAALQLIGGTVAVWGSAMLLTMAWVGAAYQNNEFDGQFPLWPEWLVSLIVGATLVSSVVVGLSLALLRGDGEGVGAFCRRLAKEGPGRALPPVLAGLTVGLVVAGLLNTGASAVSLGPMLETMNPNRTIHVAWEVVRLFPIVPIGLFAAAAMLVAHRRLLPAVFARIRGQRGETSGRTGGVLAIGLTALAGGAVTIGAFIYVVHLGMVAALGAVAELAPSMSVVEALPRWVADQRASGRGAAEIAAELQEHGYWTPVAPEAGLAALLPDLGSPLSGSRIEDSACRFTVAADVADTVELRQVEWLAPDDLHEDVKYCLAIACPNPAVWEDHPIMILYSSHPSRNPYWAENLHMDVFARGVAQPGGYCTPMGTLADRFQG